MVQPSSVFLPSGPHATLVSHCSAHTKLHHLIGTLFDSWDIALWTDSHGRNPDAAKLFPEDKREDVRKWADKGDIVQGYLRKHFSELAATDKVGSGVRTEACMLGRGMCLPSSSQYAVAAQATARQVAPAFVRGIPLIGSWLAGTAGSFAAKSIAGKFGDVGADLTLDKVRFHARASSGL